MLLVNPQKIETRRGVKKLLRRPLGSNPSEKLPSLLKEISVPMAQCTANKASGERCTAAARHADGLCGTHYNARARRDPAFRARVEAQAADAQRAQAAAAAERARRAAEEAERMRAAEAARRAAELAARRADKIAKRERHLADVPNIGPYRIEDHARKAIDIWNRDNIPGYDIPKAYAALTYLSSRHEGFIPLMTAIVRLRFQALGNHPDFANYRDVPVEERQTVLDSIRGALEPYGVLDPPRILAEDDPIKLLILNRVRAEAEAERRRLAEEAIRAAAAAEVARRAAFAAQLREAPVVFQRDPENGINLRAFANDTQSVHRSSVQNSTHKAVVALLARPALEGVETLTEIVEAFNDRTRVRWFGTNNGQDVKEIAVTEVTNDYFNTEAFSVRYGDVLDRVWAFIRGHEHHKTLCVRLAQEIYEGRSMCSNGKMARLVNVLAGFDETLETEAPREVFQFRMAALRKQALAVREAAARELFREFNIPEEEHDVWLEPLMDDDEPAPAAAGAAALPST